MKKIALSNLSISIIVLAFSVLIALTCPFVLPRYFPSYVTIWVGMLSVFVAATTVGYIGYLGARHKTMLGRVCVSIIFAAIVACLFIIISWFIIANTIGE
jgi:hypothetical protein